MGRPQPIWAPLRPDPKRGKRPGHLSWASMAASITAAGKGAARGQGPSPSRPVPPGSAAPGSNRLPAAACAPHPPPLPAFGALLKRPAITSLHLTLQKVTSAPRSSMQHVWQGIAMATFLSGLSHY